jgi:multiple sugar transport system substrate-binding protein
MNMKKITRIAAIAATAALAGVSLVSSPALAAPTTITFWAMQGQVGEVNAAKQEVAAFNSIHDDIEVKLVFKDSMGTALDATKADALPDVFEYDGETLGHLVYDGKLLKLNGLVASKTLSNALTSIKSQNTASDGNTYAVSQYDSGLSLWGNKSMLKAAGVSYPTTWEKAWTSKEFTTVLTKLAAKSKTKKAIDMKENYGIGGGWAGYAFTPVANSAGTQLLNADKSKAAFATAKVAAAMKTWASWKKFSDPSADDSAFTKKRVALAWVGHWAGPGIRTALGKDAVLIPLPNFGAGSKSGQGSHSLAIGSKSKNSAAAAKFLEFITSDQWIINLTQQNGAVPASNTSLANSKDYAKGGVLALYGEQLAASCGEKVPTAKCVTVPRSISPAWPTINTEFSKAAQTIWDGGDALAALQKAAKAVDQNIADNGGYKN